MEATARATGAAAPAGGGGGGRSWWGRPQRPPLLPLGDGRDHLRDTSVRRPEPAGEPADAPPPPHRAESHLAAPPLGNDGFHLLHLGPLAPARARL